MVLSSHALLVLLGIVFGTAVAAHHRRVPLGVVLLSAAALTASGLFGARAFYVVQRGGPLLGHSGGMASSGGIAVGLLVIAIIARGTRVRATDLLDAMAPGFLVAFGCGRLGCFLGGCCAGAVTSVPWAVTFSSLGIDPRHPLQLYSALFDFALARWAVGQAGVSGMIAVRCAVGLGVGRAILETLRDPRATDLMWPGWMTVPQVFGLLLALGAWRIGRRLAAQPVLVSTPDRRRSR